MDGLLLAGAVVALVEEQVDGLVDRAKARGEFRAWGDLKEPVLPEGGLGARESSLDGVLLGEQGLGDLLDGEAA